MRVLVTGGAGFIGSHTVDLLLHEGYQVRVLDNLAEPVHRGGEKPPYIPGDVEFILGDVRSRDDLDRALRGVDCVFHLAAYQDYLPDFSTFFHVNSVGTALLYELIVARGHPVQKVVVASSQAIYGEGRYACPQDGPQYPPPRPLEQLMRGRWEVTCPRCGGNLQVVETDESQVNPHNPYAISKHSQEMIALNLGRRYGIPSVAMRYSITQGPRQSFRNAYSGILRIFTLRLLAGEPPIAYEDGLQLRDYVYVGDVARANLLVLKDPRADYRAFNVGGGRSTSVVEYAALLARVTGNGATPEVTGEFRFGDTRHVISSIDRIVELGWKPRVALERVAREYVDWVMSQPGAKDHYAQADAVMRKVGTVRSALTARATPS